MDFGDPDGLYIPPITGGRFDKDASEGKVKLKDKELVELPQGETLESPFTTDYSAIANNDN